MVIHAITYIHNWLIQGSYFLCKRSTGAGWSSEYRCLFSSSCVCVWDQGVLYCVIRFKRQCFKLINGTVWMILLSHQFHKLINGTVWMILLSHQFDKLINGTVWMILLSHSLLNWWLSSIIHTVPLISLSNWWLSSIIHTVPLINLSNWWLVISLINWSMELYEWYY
jgi:hypothetical protein